MSDDASGPEMSNAAQFLINTCAERMGRGGTAKPLGQSPQEAVQCIATVVLERKSILNDYRAESSSRFEHQSVQAKSPVR